MTSSSYFFRVEHDLLRSEAFKTLGGSAIKVYLVIGLYSDFGTDWAYPSIRTIASHAGLSRQTVMAAIEHLTQLGLLATNKAKGRSTAYRIIRQAPSRPSRSRSQSRKASQTGSKTGLFSLEDDQSTGPDSLDGQWRSGPESDPALAHPFGLGGRRNRPKQEIAPKEDTTSTPIPGTPFRLTAEGRLLVAVDLQELLTSQGIPDHLACRLIAQKDPEAVAKVLLNALYLESEGKLQNGPGYIRAGIEDGYELLPQVASRLETRRRKLEDQLQEIEAKQRQATEARKQADEQAAVSYVLERLDSGELSRLLKIAISLLPAPIVERNPTLSNPFVRIKVYELACGEP
jgi:helix-turn-helix protein